MTLNVNDSQARRFGRERRDRMESRQTDLAGFQLPDWRAMGQREYQPWIGADLVVDTAESRLA
ncbi:MAG: hypothetical protein QNJ40_09085 [Xanthomonadales bacterium]|nr:hypothetical protein [Xanthomonadales bacterium]